MKERIKKHLSYSLLMFGMVVMVGFVIWRHAASQFPVAITNSQEGIWDLRQVNFEQTNIILSGDVAYVPEKLLTPQTYDTFQSKERLLNHSIPEEFGTSRLRIYLPEDRWYTFTRISIDYAEKLYVNGQLVQEVGRPGKSASSSIPNTARITFTAKPENGVVEIVQQSSNFVHKEGGYHGNWYVGTNELAVDTVSSDMTVAIEMGIFLALCLVHLLLFIMLRQYRLNFFFALFTFVWFLRMGVTGPKLFSFFLPQLSWLVKFRIEYISIPAALMLMVTLLDYLFPRILQQYFKRIIYVSGSIFILCFLFFEPRVMSILLSYCQFVCGGAVCYLIVRMGMKLRFKLLCLEQIVFLLGVVLLFYAGVRDILFYNNYQILPPFERIELTQVAMIVCALFAATSVMMATMRQVEATKARETVLKQEKADLDRLNQLKTELMQNVSHETRTPLAVLASYAGLVSLELKEKGMDQQMAEDLDRIAYEAKRVAVMMDSMRELSTQTTSEAGLFSYDDVIHQTTRLYQPIMKRSGTDLRIEIEADLPALYGKAELLSQVLFNILHNARKHTEQGEVVITVKREQDGILTEIQDTGEGIAPEILPHVFERGVTGRHEGSGIGLAICKDAIEEGFGGWIMIESQVGKGTMVRFFVPLGRKGDGDDAGADITRGG